MLSQPTALGGMTERIQKRDQTKVVKGVQSETTEVPMRIRTTIYRSATQLRPKERGDWDRK
jgi:hypothetical protein